MKMRLVCLLWSSCLLALAGCEPSPEMCECVSEPCEGGERVTFVLRPTDRSLIRCEMFLPADWDGRFWSVGNGGWAGTTWLERRGRSATLTCDLGTSRRGRGVIGEDDDVLKDYGWRATHLSTLAAKEVIRRKYGRAPDRSYFHGESCGGRQGLTEAVRFPEDYDGIVCGVPGLTERSRVGLAWKREQLKRKYGKWFTPEERAGIRQAELAWFAASDPEWARGNFIVDPRPTPESLSGCWREAVRRLPALADREALWRELFEPVAVKGVRVAPGAVHGTEFDSVWSFLPSKYLGVASPKDLTEDGFAKFLSRESDWAVGEPDLSAFSARGGKIIMYAGFEDLSCPEPEIREFYERAISLNGGVDKTKSFFLFCSEPGRTHGARGEAAGDGKAGMPRDLTKNIVDWVERGVAPRDFVFDWSSVPHRLRVTPYPENKVGFEWRPECWAWLISRLKDAAAFDKATNIVDRMARSGYTTLVLDGMEDIASSPERTDRLRRLDALAKARGIEIIPSLWSMGHGGTLMFAEPESVETTPAKGLRYRVSGGRATFVPDVIETGLENRVLTNGILVELSGKLKPYRTYALSCRVRTEGISPVKYFSVRGNLCHGIPWKNETELYDFIVKETQDWKEYEWTFNTYSNAAVLISVGVNRAHKVAGTCWFDSVAVRECPLRGCLTQDVAMSPVVRSEITGRIYVPGRDYAPFPKMRSPSAREALVLTVLPGGAIRDGETLLVDANVPAVQGARQYSACPSSPTIHAYWERTAAAVESVLHPKRWFFTVDEWRTANRCARCRARNVSPGELMGACVAEMAAVVRKINPKAEVCVWADMFCPLENAGRNPYYCVDGSMLDSWRHLPKDTIMVPWMNGRDDVKTTNWLMGHGFRCIAGGYYNRPDLSHDIMWRDACKNNPKFLGMMFTTWGGSFADGGYYDLEAYGAMVNER